jgi:hypothetical protein
MGASVSPYFGHIPMIELCLFVFEADFPALDESVFDDAGAHVEDVAGADDDIGVLPYFQ